MSRIPAWSWAGVAVGLVVFGLVLGVGGPDAHALARSLYPLMVSVLLPLILFAYMQQHVRPTRKLWFINLAAVAVCVFVTSPLWHFGVEFERRPDGTAPVHWWVNAVVFVLAVLLYFVLARLTRNLQPRTYAIEDKPERLTV
jgi:putative effector of murein hydrolase